MSRNELPYSFGEAKGAIERASTAQKNAEAEIRRAFGAYGDAERAYRKALALKIMELRADSVPATVCLDLAKGDAKIANLRFARDVCQGVVEAAKSAVFRHTADRRELEQLVRWSMNVAPDGQFEEALS